MISKLFHETKSGPALGGGERCNRARHQGGGGGGHGLARIIEFYRIIEFLEILV